MMPPSPAFDWHMSAIWIADPPAILLLALAIDALAGDMRPVFRYLPHPVVAIGGLVAFLDRRLNREQRSFNDRRLRGIATVAFVAGLSFALGWAAHLVFVHAKWGWAAEALAVGILVAQRSLRDHVAAVGVALAAEGLAAGRRAVAHIVGRDPQTLDEHGVARAAIESLFENFGDAVVAPVFWYLLLGLPGVLALKAINTMDSMIGHRTPRHRAFGEAAARLDTAVMFLPARIAALCLVLAAAIVPGGRPLAALRTILRDARKHRSFNAGWPEAAGAGALGLALSGPRRYHGESVDEPWIGDGRARAVPGDVERACRLFLVACLAHAALAAAYLLVFRA
jgi:adenosylcobinamide-phosphate synthase